MHPQGAPADATEWQAGCAQGFAAGYDPQELLTPAELVVILKVSERWVRQEIAAARLPAVKLGHKTLRVSRADLQTYLVERRLRP